ncbi:PrpF domain-containing protein [Streptomyces vilmorinianum]|uniref:PrpF domain-containing protein n=1 Tax=Streptomyces vilmorinianum TaxID=3051092 RepID=UPI0010FB8CC4|nr:PrpF domain-containing protein [Streptomyces vilmorinianum]
MRGPGPGFVHAAVVMAEGAPGPTLVVALGELPAGALASGGELAAVRGALVGTEYAGVNKFALYGASAYPGCELDYRFVQGLPGGRFDFRTGCGHSLLACVVAAARPGRPLAVRAVTTGDLVRCVPEAATGAYGLHFLRAPDDPGTLPTGRPVDVVGGLPVSLVRYGNPYVFVDAAHVGIPTADALFRAGDDTLRRLLALRAHAARRLGHPPHSALPKIAAFTVRDGRTAVRALTVGGWHPRLALTGAAALAAAAVIPGTVVPELHGPVRTPGGPVTVSAGPRHIGVHHKRATVLDRLRLPWRIHATA